MTSILAIELSTPRGTIAVLRDGAVVYERDFTSHRSHNSMLYAPLGEALEAAGGDLQAIVVGTGPGSYTGVRIAIAAAHGVALSRNVPVFGLPSICALSDAAEYIAVGDARRGKFYAAHVRHGQFVDEFCLHEETAMRDWLGTHAALPRFTSDAVPPLGDSAIMSAHPSAVILAKLAAANPPAPQAILEPLYVQEAFITKAKTPTMGGKA